MPAQHRNQAEYIVRGAPAPQRPAGQKTNLGTRFTKNAVKENIKWEARKNTPLCKSSMPFLYNLTTRGGAKSAANNIRDDSAATHHLKNHHHLQYAEQVTEHFGLELPSIQRAYKPFG